MRLPAVAIAALFACGAVLGQAQWFAQRTSSHVFLLIGFVAVAILICAGIFLAGIARLFPAASASALSWLVLGLLGAGIGNQPRTADYVLSLVEVGRLDFKTPLRWHGRLRDEPARLPWGYGYEIEWWSTRALWCLREEDCGLAFRRVRSRKRRRTFTRETKSLSRQRQNVRWFTEMRGRLSGVGI